VGELRGEGIVKAYAGGVRALDGVSFVARPGRVLGLLGPSGCGKSTLLRIVAGLEHASEGRLTLDGRNLDQVPPGAREVGFVFQNYALYPHLSVARNLSLALEVRKRPRAEIAARIQETAALLGIEDLLGRYPRQLSGGQQQRVALGRALARRPALYLMDEPLSNLDALLREGMRSELKTLFRKLQSTVLYVTHDQAEALSLADEVLVLERGRVRQCAPPLELYQRPADLFVASFVGSPRMTLLRGRRANGAFEAGGLRLALPQGLPGEGELWLGMRPEDVAVSEEPVPGAWEGVLELSEPGGDRVLLTVRIGEQRLRAFAEPRPWSERLWVQANQARLHWFDAGSEKRLA
jgi:multiple sugar transport system ATP-binding protein